MLMRLSITRYQLLEQSRIEPLNIPFPEDFEVYEPVLSEKILEGGLKRV